MKIDIQRYWQEPPPEPSPGLLKWVAKIRGGWQPNKRIRSLGYYNSAEFFGVYIWEYLQVLSPLLYGTPWGDEAAFPVTPAWQQLCERCGI